MRNLPQVYAALRRKNRKQYILLAGCCFFSVLLITAYVCMMRSPTVLNVLPEGGDSRKQVMMIFVLAVIGCGVFTTYASGLFFRYKSRETGIFMALGASHRQLVNQLIRELVFISLGSCSLGALLGIPLAWLIWQIFRLVLVDTIEMALTFDIQAYLFALAFSVFVIVMLLAMLFRFIRRANVMDVVNESRKAEPIRDVPRWYGPAGIVLLIGGILLGYLAPSFCMNVLHWQSPGGFASIAYLPALVGLYVFLLHTVVNGWRHGKNRYKNIIPSSMMKFQGRQTVRNMLVIAVLVAGAYFASFYVPMMGTGAANDFNIRNVDYAFRYRADQNMLSEAEIRQMASEEGVAITSYAEQPSAVLGVDGWEYVETANDFGTTYAAEHLEMQRGEVFLSESAYNALTGDTIDVASGNIMAVYDDEGNNRSRTTKEVSLVTNPVTRQVLPVTPTDDVLRNSMLFGCKVLDDTNYARITEGLTDEWLEMQVFFDVENDMETYAFAKRLFYAITDCSNTEVALYDGYDPVLKMLAEEKGEAYFLDREHQEENGYELLNYVQRDASHFRLFWKYMPKFRVLDSADFVKTNAVFLMLFIFVAIICFAAVIVIAYTRSLTIAMMNEPVYDDLRHLGASNAYLRRTVKGQISKVFFAPILTGTAVILAFYTVILYFNDGSFTNSELSGLMLSLALVAVITILLYGVYRLTLNKVCERFVSIHHAVNPSPRCEVADG